ncbi:MAG: helix-turn-helix domain-containing protein, partial [Prevotella sp.]|nr:helix-turn-helix domain-containing protein [Prevotella sp.]
SSLPDSYIISIQESMEGTLWIQTASGICIYHPQTESFERDMKQVYSKMGIEGDSPTIVYIDKQKNFWAVVPSKGLMAYNMQQQQHYEFAFTEGVIGIPQGEICSLSECKDGVLAVYTDGRIVCCDIMHQQHTVWQTDYIAEHQLRNSKTLKAFADQKDNIWLYGQGTLMVYFKATNTWNTTIGDQLGMTGISADRSVNGMAGDRKGNIWIGTDRSGLVRFSVNTHEMETVQPYSANTLQPQHDIISIQSVYVDDTDLLWVGTEKSGLAYYGDNIYKFQSDLIGDVTAMAQMPDGTVRYGTGDKGIIGYEGQLASQKVTCMTTTPDGSLWVGSKQNGLTRIKDGASTIYSTTNNAEKTLIDDHINALTVDKAGNLWIATNGGLQVYNPRMNTFSSYTRENKMLNTNNITCLYYGTDNKLLIGTGEGLMLLNLSNREKTVLTGNATNLQTFTNNYITQVFEDSRGLLWIGTREGLNILNLVNDDLTQITEADGLCNNSVCGIAEDKSHCIWVTTSNGISRIVVQRNHEDGTFGFGLYNYNISDGLQSNEYNMGSILTRQDGSVLFGGLFGISWVRHHNKDEQVSLPPVMLTQLFVGEEEIQIGVPYDGNVILQQALNESSKIELNNGQNTFTIKFAAGNYNQGERLQFMYQLEGRDLDWRNGDALLHGVKFNDLGSGTYTLHVKAVSADGAVSNQERKLQIVIDRPWWLSWWMLTVYLLIIILALATWRYGLKKLQAIWKKKKTVIDELTRQREEIKLASDELRMPMARMTTIIGDMAMKEQTLEGREQLNSLHFQLLQVITRISEMQSTLENPEKKAESTAKDRLELNESNLLLGLDEESQKQLGDTITPLKFDGDQQTKKFSIVLIDDNREFLRFMNAHLCEVYDFHVYDNIKDALPDIETLNADIVICKQKLKKSITGSELCNQFKSDPRRSKSKFVLLTDGVLTKEDMEDQNITMAADDYLAKPFKVQEAVMRFNKLLGLAPIEINQNVIEGKETRMLEGNNASMTTATMVYDDMENMKAQVQQDAPDDAETPETPETAETPESDNMLAKYYDGNTIGDYSMNSIMDQQLMRNVEQFVLQNMSRGQISLDEMASALGMGRVPFFHKIRAITTKTPAEVVRELRLKHACHLLVTTNINMSELAINVGFMTAENFINIFKEKFGMTPLEYRLKNRR